MSNTVQNNNNRDGAADTPPAHGTKDAMRVRLVIGQTTITATLADNMTARALAHSLPRTVRLSRYAHDYCGVMDQLLPFTDKDLHSGWKNGDLAYAVNGDYFAILYKDEEISQQFDGMVTLGALDCDPAIMDTLDANIAVRIELA